MAVFASFGAFTGIYGRNEPQARRFVIQLRAGLLMMILLLLAALTARAGEAFALSAADTTWLQVLASTVVAGVCSLIVAWWRLRPAGSLIHIFAFAAVASIPNQPPLWQGMLVAALTVALSLLIGVSSRVIRSHRRPWVGQKLLVVPSSPAFLLRDRIVETVIGAAVGVAVVLAPTAGRRLRARQPAL